MHNSLSFEGISTQSCPEYILAATCKIIPSHMQTEIKDQLINRIGKLIEDKEINAEIKTEESAINIIDKAAKIIGKIKNKTKHKKDFLNIPEETDNKIVFYTAHHLRFLPGTKIFDNRKHAFHEIYDFDARQGYRNSVNVFKFWSDIFGMKEKYRIKATIHYKKNYNNAHYHPTSNKNHIIFGDGNKYFGKFVRSLAVVAHEMFHAITKNRLNYYGESGALNEHYSDIVGACCDMYINNISVLDYHWEFAPDILHHKKKTYPIRSFKAPGTAYNLPILGKDPQPDDYQNVDPHYPKDHGGVHIYSGIPNHVFYLVCLACNDWREPIIFWKKILDNLNDPNITFSEFADLQIQTAIYAGNENLATALREAWNMVNVPLSACLKK